MAIVTRYFSTAGAGAADGTTWADRAALFSAGNWSTVLTGFAFNGSDSLKCLIGPGSYTCSQALASGLFANAPSAANPLVLHACDGSGAQLAIPEPEWTSAQPVTWDTALPVIATTTNISTINLAHCVVILLKFTATGTAAGGAISAATLVDWCVVEHSGAATSIMGINSTVSFSRNCAVKMSGASYRAAIVCSGDAITNCRCEGVTGTSGNRYGIELTGSTVATPITRCTVFGFGGDGIGTSSATAGHRFLAQRNAIANNAGTGIKTHATASQTAHHLVEHNMITGNGAWGLDGQSAGRVIALGNRLRDNASGNITGLGNYPTDLNNETTDSDDASDYVNAAGGDFRIKNTAAIWGTGVGVSDQAPAGGGGGVGCPIIGGAIVRTV